MTDDGSAGRQIGGPVIPDLSVDDDPINGRTCPSHYRDQTKSGHFCPIPVKASSIPSGFPSPALPITGIRQNQAIFV